MSLPRVVLITRRFWPMFGGPEVMMARLAAGLQRSGVRTTVVTAKAQRDWPTEFEHYGAQVVRLQPPGAYWLSGALYLARLRGWLLAHRTNFDLAYVSGLRHDAYAALLAGRRAGFPVVLRAEQAGLAGDCHWQLNARFGRTIKQSCRRAAAIVAATPLIEREVIAAGYPRERIHKISLGVPEPTCVGADARLESRRALAASQRRLAVPPTARLAVFAGRFVEGKGLLDLIEAWSIVLQSVADAHLWLVGEGPEEPRLAAEIARRRLGHRIALAGAFDDVEDCLCSADLFVVASRDEGGVLALLEAMSLGLPSVVSATTTHQQVIEDGKQGRLVPIGEPRAMAEAIVALWQNRDAAARMGREARQRIRSEFTFDRCLQEHLALLEQVQESFAR